VDAGGFVDVREALLVPWRARWWALLATLLGAALAFTGTLLRTPQYEAESVIRHAAVVTDTAGELLRPASISRMSEEFVTLLRNRSIAARVIADLSLHTTVADFLADVIAIESQRAEVALLTIRATWADAATATRIANRYAEESVAFNRTVNRADAGSARDFLAAELERSRTSLREARARYLEYRRQAQVEVLRKDIDAALAVRGRLPEVRAALSAEKARLSEAQGERGQRQSVIGLTRSIENDPVTAELLRQGGVAGNSLLSTRVQTEVLNPTFFAIDERLADARLKVEALTKEQQEIEGRLGLSSQNDRRLQALYERELELSRLALDVKIAEEAYSQLSEDYLQASVQVARRTADLQIVDRAIQPDRPARPRPVRDTIIGAALGAVLSLIAVFARWIVAPSNARSSPAEARQG
jgi:uncharacterized protein involved in exopolysaccharide biosynthesis